MGDTQVGLAAAAGAAAATVTAGTIHAAPLTMLRRAGGRAATGAG